MPHTTKHSTGNAAMAKALAGILAISLAACGKSPDESTAAAPSSSMGDVIDNTVVTARIKSALMANPRINSYDFKVETRIDQVQLSGFVDSQAQIDRAMALTQAIPGVKHVANEMAIKK